jgi:hypothetical protein
MHGSGSRGKDFVTAAKSGLLRTALGAAATSLVALALAAPSAEAGPLVRSAGNCDTQVYERPFTRWLDFANYVLLPGGDLERPQPAGWTLGRASVTPGNETYYVHSRSDASSLAIPKGTSVQSAPICVGIDHPTLRLFVRNKGRVTSTLKVEVLFENSLGLVGALPIGALVGTAKWLPTVPIPVTANLLPLLPGARTAVAFRFTPLGTGGDWAIDDVYVDPHRRG